MLRYRDPAVCLHLHPCAWHAPTHMPLYVRPPTHPRAPPTHPLTHPPRQVCVEVVHVFIVLTIRVEEDAVKGAQLQGAVQEQEGRRVARQDYTAAGWRWRQRQRQLLLQAASHTRWDMAGHCTRHNCAAARPLPSLQAHLIDHILPAPEHQAHAGLGVPAQAAGVLVDVWVCLNDGVGARPQARAGQRSAGAAQMGSQCRHRGSGLRLWCGSETAGKQACGRMPR